MTGLDLDQARRFLDLLDEEAPAFTFQLATDAEPKPKPDHLAKIINLPPDNLKALAVRNGNGAAVWVMVNEGSGKGRRAENVTRVRAVFADLDGSPIDPAMRCELEPHCVVESSPGKYHVYWLTDGLPLDQFAGVQRRIATMFNGDSICDLPRVMRLPGFVHQKDPAKPFMVRIVHQAERLPYSAAEILRVFPPLEDGKSKATGNGRADLPDPLDPGRLEELRAAHPKLFEPCEHTAPRDFALACLVARLGWTEEEAVALIRRVQAGSPKGKGDRPDYLWNTVTTAYQKATTDDQQDLERLIERATSDPGAAFEGGSIDFLAALRARDPAAYERARARLKTAKVRVAALDQEVERRKPDATDSGGKGKALKLPEPEPWLEPVAGAELLTGLIRQIGRYVVVTDPARTACALWVIHTHAHDAAFISPRLVALSPTKRCGKSSLFRTLARMARRPLPTSNISPSAMYRVIEAASPTLFCDEMSSIGDPERATEVRGVVNSSHCRAEAQIIRNVPVADGYEPRAFSTWAPMALAYIKHVDDQIRDRAVIIPMQRKAPDQAVEQMRLDRDDGFGELARKCARWAADHFDELRRADPDMPRELNDRAADNWRCLLAIADVAGGPWPERARKAAVALSIDAEDEDVIGVEVLRDLQVVFGTLKADRLASEAIVAHLVGMEGRPWAEFGRAGKPITKHQLARLVKPFKIAPATVRLADETTTAKGYKRESFLPLWERYFQNVTTSQPTARASFSDFQTVTPESDVTFRNRPKATATATCDVVTDRNGGSGGEERELVASACPRCGFQVFRDNATQTGGGVWLHPSCVP